MTQATKSPMQRQVLPKPALQYWVGMSHPESHLFEVTLQVYLDQLYPDGNIPQVLDLKMPVWTPGSYLIREYARHLQDFRVDGSNHPIDSKNYSPLNWRKISKNNWQVELKNVSALTIQYRIFANELTVRTNHLDMTHGYFNGAALFFFIPERQKLPYHVTIIPPNDSWKVTTSLPSLGDDSYTFIAADFDTLVDNPFEIGSHEIYDFEVRGKSHQLAIWGEGNYEARQIVEDMGKIIEQEAEIFGGLPYDSYLFLLHLSSTGFGGLEHKFCCSLIYNRFGFKSKEKYDRFMQLVAHEFFHLWNVKRIRPKGLEVFDYEQENYTTCLWFSEGTTSYYDLIIPLRAKIYDRDSFLHNLSKEITRLFKTPGRLVHPVSESSWDAWIKLYRRDANSDNCQISYYLKGEIISLLLDLLIRAKSHNKRSLDDVMHLLWQRFGKDEIGFTDGELKSLIELVAEQDLTDFFTLYVDGTEELPINEYLAPFGLELQPMDLENMPPYLGAVVATENGKEIIKFVEANSPAQKAGIDAGDELLAIDGFRVTAEHLGDRLKNYLPWDVIKIALFHQEELRICTVRLERPQPHRYQVVKIDNPTKEQKHNLIGWLGN